MKGIGLVGVEGPEKWPHSLWYAPVIEEGFKKSEKFGCVSTVRIQLHAESVRNSLCRLRASVSSESCERNKVLLTLVPKVGCRPMPTRIGSLLSQYHPARKGILVNSKRVVPQLTLRTVLREFSIAVLNMAYITFPRCPKKVLRLPSSHYDGSGLGAARLCALPSPWTGSLEPRTLWTQ